MGIRVFAAVDVDEQTRQAIGRLSDDVRRRLGGRTRASWVRPDRLHLTLLFFADADAALEARLRAAFGAPVDEPPFTLTFDGLGRFPERGSPRVLWLAVRDGAASLRRIESALRRRLGLPPAPFAPHLTLARFRERVARGQEADFAGIPASAGPSRIDRVTLYESRLSPAGPTYLKLAEAPLLCPPSSP